MENVLLIVLFVLLIFSFYMLIRNNLVRDFLLDLNRTGGSICTEFLNSIDPSLSDEEFHKKLKEYDKLYSIYNEMMDGLKYEKVLLSFKPLHIKYWLTKEQLDFIKLAFNEYV